MRYFAYMTDTVAFLKAYIALFMSPRISAALLTFPIPASTAAPVTILQHSEPSVDSGVQR